MEATGVEGGAGDVPFATLDHRVMIHPPRSLRLHTLHYLTIPLCPWLCVYVGACVRACDVCIGIVGCFKSAFFCSFMAQCVVVCGYACVCVCVCVCVCEQKIVSEQIMWLRLRTCFDPLVS